MCIYVYRNEPLWESLSIEKKSLFRALSWLTSKPYDETALLMLTHALLNGPHANL